MSRRFLPFCFLLLSLSWGCREAAEPVVSTSYRTEIEAWRADRLAALKAPDGWPSLAGLFELAPGVNTFGSDPDNDLFFPAAAPPRMGRFLVEGDEIRIDLEENVVVEVADTVLREGLLSMEDPALMTCDALQWYLIERGGRPFVRLRDTLHPARFALDSLPYFPIDPSWRVQARFIPFDPPQTLPVRNVLDMDIDQQCDGKLAFEKNGRTYEIWVLDGGPEEYFLIFADETTGDETYGGGRYLYVPKPDEEGITTIDFNKAYNPPCVFTEYATCLLPPAENRLEVAVRAGELMYGEAH